MSWNQKGNSKTLSFEEKEKLDKDKEKAAPVCWSVGTKRVEKCELAPKNFLVSIPYVVDRKIHAVSKKMDKLEWLGYLVGDEVQDVYFVHDVIVPEQVVTAGSVEVTAPLAGRPDVLGTIHLHPFSGGGMFFSNTDEHYIGGNNRINIVTNPEGKYKGMVKVTLPCGSISLVDTDIIVEDAPAPKGIDKFVDESIGKITEYVAPPVTTPVKQVTKAADSYPYAQSFPVYYCAECRAEINYTNSRWRKGFYFCNNCANKVDKGEIEV